MGHRSNRRDFLKVSAVAGAGFWVAGGVSEGAQREGANERLNIAIVGVGGRGSANVGGVAGENIVALCDVDDRQAAKIYAKYDQVPKYKDFRVMLDKQGKGIDAVVVSTPDHTHAVAAAMALRMGKHVYCEKPLTHSVWEARQLKELAAKSPKLATQMGNQGTSSGMLRTAVEIVRAGTLGDVREVHVWTNRPIWPQNIARPKQAQEPPKGVSFDLWLGPAAERPYHEAYLPFRWRGWWDFGTGALGDMACHTMNLPFLALRLGAPTSVVADVDPKGNAHMNETPPLGCTVTYEFPERAKLPACRLFWYERRLPPAEKLMGQKPSGSGCVIVGSKGSLYSPSDYGDRYILLPEAAFRDHKPPTPSLERSPGHHQEWIRACKGGQRAMSNFVDHACPLTETVLLGNVAMRVGKRVVWDAEKLRAVDLPQADQYIRREYRKGWSL